MISLTIHKWAHKPCKDFERAIFLSYRTGYGSYAATKAYEYARYILKKRWPKGENIILANSYASYLYAKNVVKGRWRKAEAAILDDRYENGWVAYLYARYILKSRWVEAEPIILKEFRYACDYAASVMKTRWKAAEKRAESKNTYSSPFYYAKYARRVIKGRWNKEKIEIALAESHHIKEYMDVLQGSDRDEFYNKVLMMAMTQEHDWLPAKSYIRSCTNKNS